MQQQKASTQQQIKVQKSLNRTGHALRVQSAHEGGRLSDLRTGRLILQEVFLVLFSNEAESTSGPQCSRKDVNGKFQAHHRKSNL